MPKKKYTAQSLVERKKNRESVLKFYEVGECLYAEKNGVIKQWDPIHGVALARAGFFTDQLKSSLTAANYTWPSAAIRKSFRESLL